MNPILNFLSTAITPITNLIDNLHTSDEERLTIKAKLFEMQSQLASQVIEYEGQLLKAKSDIIVAEAKGASWIQRSWRPITMLTFLFLVVMDAFGWLPFRLADKAWTLLQIGLGGYVVGRSFEKTMPQVAKVMSKD